MTFSNYCDTVFSTLNIKIQDKQISRVESYKYLDIFVDYNMK